MPAVVEKDGRVRIVTDVVDVSGTTATTLYACNPYYKKFILKRLLIYNTDSADHVVTLGAYDTTGSSWSEDKYVIPVSTGAVVQYGEGDLPEDFVMTEDPTTAVMAWAAKLEAAVTSTAVKIKAEFELL